MQKFNYLKAQLHGDASQAIVGLPLTSAKLQSCHSTPTRTIWAVPQNSQCPHASLTGHPKPVNSLSSLRLFLDSIESQIRGLAALGKSEDSYGALLIPIILRKLPAETRRNLTRFRTSLKWTLSELKESILTEIKISESGLSIESLEKISADNSPTMMTSSFHRGASVNTTPPSSQA